MTVTYFVNFVGVLLLLPFLQFLFSDRSTKRESGTSGRVVTTDVHDDSSALSQLSYVDPFVSMRCIHEEEAPIGVDNVSPMSSIVTFVVDLLDGIMPKKIYQ